MVQRTLDKWLQLALALPAKPTEASITAWLMCVSKPSFDDIGRGCIAHVLSCNASSLPPNETGTELAYFELWPHMHR